MRNYLKYILYYSLGVYDSIVNLLCSLFKCYPGIQSAEDFIFSIEYGKAGKVVKERNADREEKASNAREDMGYAQNALEEDIYGKRH